MGNGLHTRPKWSLHMPEPSLAKIYLLLLVCAVIGGLFEVGLKLDVYHVRHIGSVALATGLG